MGDLSLAEGNGVEALKRYREAADVVVRVADGLTNSSLRETFLQSQPIQQVLAQSKG